MTKDSEDRAGESARGGAGFPASARRRFPARKAGPLVLALTLLLAGAGLGLTARPGAAAEPAAGTTPTAAAGTSPAKGQVAEGPIARGKYLATVGDCQACHSRTDGQPFAGGTPIDTPFGTIYSTNITPDPNTGIGKWTDDDFYNALHKGHGPDGKLFYPAFPYVFFSKVTRQDAIAIKDYLFSLKPVHQAPRENELDWPFNYRWLLTFWRMLFFHDQTFHPDPKRSAVYNRGAYLVQGLGHCGACHTPRNFLGAIKPDMALTGATLSGWHAPDISLDKNSTIRDMTIRNIATFLKTGAAEPQMSGFGPQTAVFGPMAEVVHRSLSHLTDADLTAIATYLKGGGPHAEPAALAKPAAQPVGKGQEIYVANCAACHGQNGRGLAPFVPALAQNPAVELHNSLNVVHVIMEGAPRTPEERYSPAATMPAFGKVLKDDEIAAVATYIRTHWKNKAPGVSTEEVEAQRK